MQRRKTSLMIVPLSAIMLIAAGEPEQKKNEAAAEPAKEGESAAQPTKTDEPPPRPKLRNWTVNRDGFSFSFEFNPGIPKAGELTEILVLASEIPKTPHPRYGTRVPLAKAKMTLEALAPNGDSLGRYLLHEMPLANGKYGMHLTPANEGIHSLRLRGKAKGKELSADVKLPVDVWPLPKELQGTGDEAGGRTSRRPIASPKKGS